ncbi:hypothetical protein KIL84_019190 [Mauremys mutica]|uniref:Chromodomain helicase DNA binding protein 1 like n=1 Tax=Mauremys mutica TaxID=74926 RepID=A0A9D3XVX2_9SAUR|nr:hypothetical protein KIL84_019190 [Mauremys mutica]
MSHFFQTVCNKPTARTGGPGVKEKDLRQWGLTGIQLRSYQMEGVKWLVQCYDIQHGCILGDEMGLGKTCQTIALLVYLTGKLNKRPFLILCPLSVLSNWKEELERFAPGLSYVAYAGDKEERAKLQWDLKADSHFHVLLTTYEAHSLFWPSSSESPYDSAVESRGSSPKLLMDSSISHTFSEPRLFPSSNQPVSLALHRLLAERGNAFENEAGKKVKLQNVLIQLRKCVAHPYLFSGVEPEPFEIGDHLVEASGKLCLLDKLLSFLYAGGHRVLLFSQMTRMLDILQDYMDYRGYSYERLDGSVRGEERHLAIKNFGQQPIFIFLLSTRAGGVGMNLTAADTVIFVDSDFNPQNDLQATARAHRIGQNKPVKIIRLIGRDTVEEIIYRRAASKLQFTNTVIEGGQFALGVPKCQDAADMQLSEILKFGLDKLLSLEGSTIQDVELESILGETKEGMWVMDVVLPSEEEESREQDTENHMYLYEGKDYSKDLSREDRRAFDQLLDLQKVLEETNQEGRALRNKANVLVTGLQEVPTRRKHALSPEELEARRRKRQEEAAKRARLMEEKKQKKAEAEHKKKMAWWEANHYRSPCLPSEESDSEDAFEEGEDRLVVELDETDPELNSIKYVMGDVTHPRAEEEDAIVVHCIDDSGRWGRGGLFTALEVRSDQPRKIYELAGRMKDVALGRTLLFPIDDKESRNKGQDLLALIVAQHRDRSNNLSGIKLSALEEGLKKIYLAAKKRNASVHLPRIGHATKGFNWYGTERLIRKYLATRGIPTSIYYFPRNKASSSSSQPSTTSMTTSNP